MVLFFNHLLNKTLSVDFFIQGINLAPPMRREAVTRSLGPLCAQLVVTPLADSGHYPMQEMPPLTVALVERFLGG
jgi:hypothetical protein